MNSKDRREELDSTRRAREDEAANWRANIEATQALQEKEKRARDQLIAKLQRGSYTSELPVHTPDPAHAPDPIPQTEDDFDLAIADAICEKQRLTKEHDRLSQQIEAVDADIARAEQKIHELRGVRNTLIEESD